MALAARQSDALSKASRRDKCFITSSFGWGGHACPMAGENAMSGLVIAALQAWVALASAGRERRGSWPVRLSCAIDHLPASRFVGWKANPRFSLLFQSANGEELSPRGTWHPCWQIYLVLLPDDLSASCFRATPRPGRHAQDEPRNWRSVPRSGA